MNLDNQNEARSIISKLLFPDTAFYNCKNKTLYIIEKKEQKCSGSVDEKLQTCDFKLRQYKRLVEGTVGRRKFQINHVEYFFILNNYFEERKDGEYRDVLQYIREIGCQYYFNKITIKELGL